MKHRWFWGTLLAWSLFSASMGGRALIFFERPVLKRLHRFEVRTNGLSQRHEIWASEGGPDAFQELSQRWMREGWTPALQDLDLACALLELPQGGWSLASMAQISAFRKAERVRLLATAATDHGSNAWVTELPLAAVDDSRTRRDWDFPIRPPEKAEKLLCIGSGAFRSASWRRIRPIPSFASWARQQGYECGDPTGPDGMPSCLLLKKGTRRLIAVIRPSGAYEDVCVSPLHD